MRLRSCVSRHHGVVEYDDEILGGKNAPWQRAILKGLLHEALEEDVLSLLTAAT